MGTSAEFITGTLFTAVMVVIGLSTIWIVRWQIFFLLNHQSRSRKIFVLHPGSFAFAFPLHDALTIIPIYSPRPGAPKCLDGTKYISPPVNGARNPSPPIKQYFDDRLRLPHGLRRQQSSSRTREMISDTAPFGSVAVGQIPNIVVPDNTSSKTDGTSVLRSTTSSCNSSLNHELSSETIETHPAAIEGFHALAGNTVSANAGEDTNVDEKSSSNPAQITSKGRRGMDRRGAVSDAYATFDNSGLDRKLSAVGEFGSICRIAVLLRRGILLPRHRSNAACHSRSRSVKAPLCVFQS
jgi:hypothetical protein